MKGSESKKQPQWLPQPVRITEQVWPEGTVPVVSVFCVTYNHERFICDAIEGFLMQETTFPVEIFVHDDASTDDTTEIVKEYAGRYPQLFWTVLQTENQYSKAKFAFFFEHLARQRGEFIAMCEGDDYWTNPKKLQKQVDMMVSKPHLSLCYHRYELRPLSSEQATSILPISPVGCVWDLFSGSCYPHTASMLFRRTDLLRAQCFLSNAPYGDIAIQLALADVGLFGFLDGVWSVHRKHEGGISATDSRDKMAKTLINIAHEFNARSGGKYAGGLGARLVELHLWGAGGALKQNDLAAFDWHKTKALAAAETNNELMVRLEEFNMLLLNFCFRSLFARSTLQRKFVIVGRLMKLSAERPTYFANVVMRHAKNMLRRIRLRLGCSLGEDRSAEGVS